MSGVSAFFSPDSTHRGGLSDTWIHSLPSLETGSGVTGWRDSLQEARLEEEKILKARKTLCDIIVQDNKTITDKIEKIKTLDTFRRIWAEQKDESSLRKKTLVILADSTHSLIK